MPPIGSWPPAKPAPRGLSGSVDSTVRRTENEPAPTPAPTPSTSAPSIRDIGDQGRRLMELNRNEANVGGTVGPQNADLPNPPPPNPDPHRVERKALGVLNANWDHINGRDNVVSLNDLGKIAEDSSEPVALQRAAQYFVENPGQFELLDTAGGGADNDKLVSGNITARLETIGPSPTAIQQLASHNSYEQNDSLQAQFDNYGVHSFELDIHNDLGGSRLDRMRGRNHLPEGEWDVRHDGGDASHGALAPQLETIANLDTDQPITLFLDLKGRPLADENHSPEKLDQLLEETFGDRLFTPEDMMARAPGAQSLQEAVQIAGWPSDAELEGKVIVGLTAAGNIGLNRYHDADRDDSVDMNAFIAPKIGTGQFDPQDNAVIYNIKATQTAGPDNFDDVADTNREVMASGNLVRNYDVTADSFDVIAASGANFIGTDHYSDLSLD